VSERFSKSFTQQEPIPEEAIAAAVAVMRHGRLHRYNLGPGEVGETALLEQDFAAAVGARYCLAVASGGYALGCALRAAGVGPGEPVLTNAFTLAPVPGAIAAAGARPVLVEVTDDLVIDIADFARKAGASGARVLMLSHMRGHICDMERLMDAARAQGVAVIEDCAHTMGAAWKGVPSGRWGLAGCYSTQTYKHLNSGEGGLIVTDDPEMAARMVLLSGSYMLYGRHLASPPPEVFEKYKFDIPNASGRMDNLRAAILRVQLRDLPRRRERWNALYRTLEAGLREAPGIRLVRRPQEETLVGSSFQFLLPGWPAERIAAFLAAAQERGVELKWFGAAAPSAFTSRHVHWAYAGRQDLPQTDRILAGLIDLRLPLTFTPEDAALIARILREEAARIDAGGAGAAGSGG